MKLYFLPLFLAILLMNACGQTGPLYLPTETPPIATEPDDEDSEDGEEENEEDKEEILENEEEKE